MSNHRWSIFFLLCALGVSVAQESKRLPEDRVRDREKWNQRGRMVKGESAAALRLRAYRQKMDLRRKVAERKAAATRATTSVITSGSAAGTVAAAGTGPTWTNLGPAPIISDPTGAQSYGFEAGRVTAVTVDQSDLSGNTVYIGAAYGGLWKSTNAADPNPANVVWTPLADDQPTLAIGAIAIQPGNPNLLLVGTGEHHSSGLSYYGLGFLRSTDGGATWELIDTADSGARSFKGTAISRIAFSGDNPNLVVASTTSTIGASMGVPAEPSRGIYYSTDAGQTWSYASVRDGGVTVTPASTSSVVWHPAAHKFFAAVRFHGLYESTDGINWNRLAAQPAGITLTNCPSAFSTSCLIYRGEISLRRVSDTQYDMYVWIVGANDENRGIYRSSNNGVTWTTIGVTGMTANCLDGTVAQGCGTSQGTYNLALLAVPRGSATDLYAGAVNLFKCSLPSSTALCNLTTSWINLTHVYGCTPSAVNAHVHPDQQAMDYSLNNPNIIYIGNDGGIFRTLNGPGLNNGTCSGLPNPFDNLSGTIGSLTQFISFTNHPTDDSTLVGGTQDNGSPATDGSNGLTWHEVNGGDGGFNDIDPTSPNTWYTAYTDVSIQKCTQGVNCTSPTFPYIVTSTQLAGDHGDFYTPYMLDPQNPSRLIIGTCRVWRGPTSSAGWSTANRLSNNFDTNGTGACTGFETSIITALAAGGPKSSPDANGVSTVIYAGTASGDILSSTNAGVGIATWTRGSLDVFKIADIAIDPSDPTGRTAVAVVMGFGAEHVRRTTDGGASWGGINNDLPDAPANAVLYDPVDPSIIYVGTDVGVFYTTNTGVSWQEYGVGLPNVPVYRLRAFNSGGIRKLRAATHGRGIWETDLALATPDFSFGFPGPHRGYAGRFITLQGGLTSMAGYSSPITFTCDASGQPVAPSTCAPQVIVPAPDGQLSLALMIKYDQPGTHTFRLVGTGSDPLSVTHDQLITVEVADFQVGPPVPASFTIPRGNASADFTVELTRSPEFTDSVVFLCDGLPAGATCSFSTQTVPPAPGTPATVTGHINTLPTTPVGSYAVQVRGTSTPGIVTRLAPTTIAADVTLNTTFLLAATPTTLTGTPTQVLESAITVTSQDGYEGSVALTCAVSPPGPPCEVTPPAASVFPASSTLSVDANGAAPGDYTIVLTADDGSTTKTIDLSLRVGDVVVDGVPAQIITYTRAGTALTLQLSGAGGYTGPVRIECTIEGVYCRREAPYGDLSLASPVVVRHEFSFDAPGTFSIRMVIRDAVTAGVLREFTVPVTVRGFTVTSPAAPITHTINAGDPSIPPYDIVFTPLNGYDLPTRLSCDPVNGLTCTFSPSDLILPGPGPTTVTVTMHSSPQLASSSYNIGVNAAGNHVDIDGFTGPGGRFLFGMLYVRGFHFSLEPHYTNVMVPGTTQALITTYPDYGFTNPITLACPPMPVAGVNCSITPNPVLPGEDAILTVTASPDVPGVACCGGEVVATASTGFGGTIEHHTPFSANVIRLLTTITPTTATVPQGGTASYNVTYAGAPIPYVSLVGLSCSGLGPGMSCSFSFPSLSSGQTGTVLVSTTAGVTPAMNTFQIVGTGDGISTSATVTLRVSDFSLSSTSTARTVNAGSSTSVTLTARALNGFASTVAMSCPGAPAGMTCTFTPASLVPSSAGTTVTATILPAASMAPGVYSVPLTATGAGLTRVVNASLTVRSFHLTATPPTLVLPTGTLSGNYNITLFADQGFASSVSLSCNPLTTGVTCAFTPSSLVPTAAGAASTLRVSFASTLAPGTRTVNLRAASGALVQTQALTLINGADFSMSTLPPASKSTEQTAPQDFHVLLTPSGGFNQPVTLSCTGLPTGGSCSFDQNPVTPAPGGTDVTVTVSTTLASPPATYNFTVQGSGAGLTRSTTATLILDFFPDFTLATPASLLAVRPGQTATFPVTVGRNGTYDKDVALFCSGAMPSGAACSVAPPTVDLGLGAQLVNVTVTTSAGTPLGDVAFALHGQEVAGPKVHDLPLTVRVNDFTLAAPTSQTAEQTGTAVYSLTVTGQNNLADAVALSCSGLPANVGPCSFAPNNFVPSAAGTPVTLTLPVGAAAAPGPTSFQVDATAGGVTHSLTESLTVTLVQDFTFAPLGATSATVLAGSNAVYPAVLTPLNSFSANVAISCSGLPAGAGCVTVPAPIPAIGGGVPQPFNLVITTSASTPAATSTVTVTATDPVSGKTHSIPLTLAVQKYTLSITPVSRTIPPGAATTYAVSLVPQNGFNRPTLIGCTPPTGITCLATPSSISPGTSAVLEVATTPTTTAGARSIPVVAFAGLGAPPEVTQNVSLTVSTTAPSFTLTASPATRTIAVGGSTTYTLALRSTTTASPGTVTLSCTPPLPPGITCAFSRTSLIPTTTTASVTLTVNAAGAAVGSYTLGVQGSTTSQIRRASVTLNASDFTLDVTPPTGTISTPGGGSTTYDVALTALSGFASAVTLSCPTPPTGVTCAFSPASVTPTAGGAHSTLTLTTSAAATPGPLEFTVRGAAGTLSHSKTVGVINGLDFSLSVTPAVTLDPGSSATAIVSATTIGGFSAPVTLSCTAVLPPPATGTLVCSSFTPNPFDPQTGSSTLQLTASPDLAPGSYTLQISGAGGGFTRSRNLTVNVPDYRLRLFASSALIGDVPSPASMSGDATAIGGFSGTVSFTCAASHPGIACTPPLPRIVSSVSTLLLDLVLDPALPPGAYTVTLNGDDGAGHARSVSATLSVDSYSLAVPPSTSLEAGTSKLLSGSVVGTVGFNGPVSLACDPPPGLLVTCTFMPGAFSGTGANPVNFNFDLAVDAATAPGVYALDVEALSGGAIRTATLSVTVTPTVDFSFALASGSLQFDVGSSGGVGFTLTSINGFASSVSLTCTGLPAGLTCGPASGTPSAGGTPGTLLVNSSGFGPGQATITVTASGGGKTHSRTLNVTVRDFILSVAPASITVVPGGTADYALSVVSAIGSFPDPIDLACEILTAPAGTSCSFDSNPVSIGASIQLHVATTAATPGGSFTVRVTATSDGITHVQDVTLVTGVSDFSLSASITSRTLFREDLTLFPITVTALGTFASSVTFTCSGLPAGVSCSPVAAFVPSTSGTTKNLLVSATPSALPGTRTFTLTVTGGGKTHSITLTVNII